jgi:hypothetical protein
VLRDEGYVWTSVHVALVKSRQPAAEWRRRTPELPPKPAPAWRKRAAAARARLLRR